MKKGLFTLLLIGFMIILAGCTSTSTNDEKKLVLGATAGPYSDQLKEGIVPLLEEKGYKVDIVEFNDYIQPNIALNEGEIDANLYQNRNYLKNFNEENGMDLVPVFAVPTAPMALYSDKHTSLNDIDKGMTITLPNDPTNLARALHIAEHYGWISIDQSVNPLTASEKDILENKFDLNFKPIEAAQTPRSLSDADYAFINGNFAIDSGLQLEEAVDLERTQEDFLIYLTVRKEDKNSTFVKDLEEAYKSKEFLHYTNENSKGYVKPPYQHEMEEGQ